LAYNFAILSFLAGLGHDVTVVLARPRLPGLRQETGGLKVVGLGLRSGNGWVAVARPKDALRIFMRGALALLPDALGEKLRRQGRGGEYGDVDAVLGRFLSDDEARAAAAFAAGADWVMADTIFRVPVLRVLAQRPPHPDPPPQGGREQKRPLASPSPLAGEGRGGGAVGVHEPRRPRTAIITHDIFHTRHAALSARGLKLFPPKLSTADEAAFLAQANLLVAIQPEEAETLRTLAPAATVVTAPMPARAVPRPAHIARAPRRLVFVGSASAHNTDGMRWFLAEIWPRLHKTLPEVRLDVAGTVCRELGTTPDGVILHGMVPSLAPLLHRASLAVAPLLAGSGLKIKLLDYAAHGLATVTTGIGTAGFLRTEAWPFIETDGAEAFAAAIAAHATGAEAREAAALDYVKNYEAVSVFAPLAQALSAAAA
jgi:glycosyltransferase involved in cell wall biosynthesis